MFSVHLFVKAWQRQVQAILASKLGIPKLQVQSNGKMPKYKIITVKYWQWCKTLLSNILFHQLHPKGLSVTRQRFQPAWKGRFWRILFFHVVFPLWLCDPNSTQSARTSGRKREFSTLCIKNHSFIFSTVSKMSGCFCFVFSFQTNFAKKKTCLSPRHSTEHPDLAKETTKTTFSVLLFLTKRNEFDLCKHEISEIHENSKIKDFCGQSC